jgi:hypothetical protein
MAVTLVNTDLIAPNGLLMAEMFPVNGASLPTYVTQWIAKATTAVANIDAGDQDDAATAWVYWRGFAQAANELASLPASAKTGDQSEAWNASQIQRLEGVAGQWRAEYLAYADTPAQTVLTSTQATVVRSW